MKWLVVSLAFFTAGIAHAKVALEQWFDESGDIWSQSPEEFMRIHGADGFQWMTAARQDAARAALPFAQLMFLDEKIWETVVRFEGGKPKVVTVSLYNRGDAGGMEESDFAKFMKSVDEKLNRWVGEQGVTLRAQERTTIATIHRRVWVKGAHCIELVWSFSEKSRLQGILVTRPEYARLEFTHFDPQTDQRKQLFADAVPTATVSVFDLRKHVRRLPNADVYVPDVPMVDQGLKGYCAAAVAERLLRYYGRDVDQHEIAQLANTSSQGGTNPRDMMTALRRIGDELRMDVTVLRDFDGRDFEKMLDDYNREARRTKQPQFNLVSQQGNFIYINDPVRVYTELDPTVLKAARLRHAADMDNFKQTVVKFTASGAPLAWCVMLGKIDETPKVVGAGGHMRLILGYNEKTDEILYSDTWGAGHEFKRLSLANAWTITLGLYCMHPREIRF